MYKLAVVEDEQNQVEIIKKYLLQYERDNSVEFDISYFSDGDELVEKYDCSFDLILSDIMMQFMDGMTAAEEVRKKDDKVVIIFITNMINFAIKGYQVGAFDYILKPISYFQLEKSLNRAISKLGTEDKADYLTIGNGSSMQKLVLNEIQYIESYAHYLTFHTTRGEYRTYMKMKDLENALKERSFFRISKSAIVNLRYVDGIEDGYCSINGILLSISRNVKKDFMERLTCYMYNGSVN